MQRSFFARTFRRGAPGCGAVPRTFVGACLLLIALELWRPCFFLTDDNMTNWLPMIVGIGRRAWSGEPLGVEPFLFGGHYNLLHDPNALFCWNPLTFLLSFLANSRFYFVMADAFAIVHLLVGASGFAFLLVRLQRWYGLTISPNRIVFLSLSLIFCEFSLTVGASWVTFLANQAALPMLLLGLLHPRRKTGVAWVTAGCLYSLTMGHISPFLFTLLFFAVFAGLWSRSQRTLEPVLRFGAAVSLSCLLMSPLLFQALQGFQSSARGAAMSVDEASVFSIGPLALVASYFFGFYGVIFCVLGHLQTYGGVQAFASCAAAYDLFATSGARARAHKTAPRAIQIGTSQVGTVGTPQAPTALQDIALAMMLLIALFVWRPFWLGDILHALPLLRSLRWPFRELFVLMFWLHLWLALRPVQVAPRVAMALNGAGLALFLASQITLARWGFSPMRVDRNLLISGEARRFWQKLAPRFGPQDQLIVVVDPPIQADQLSNVPFSLLGAYDYPALFGVRSASGYTSQGLANVELDGRKPNHWSGTFSRADADALLAKHPHLKALQLVSLHPLRIDFRQGKTREPLQVPVLNPDFPAR